MKGLNFLWATEDDPHIAWPTPLDDLEQLRVAAELNHEIGLHGQGVLGVPGLVVVVSQIGWAGHLEQEKGVGSGSIDLLCGLI